MQAATQAKWCAITPPRWDPPMPEEEALKLESPTVSLKLWLLLISDQINTDSEIWRAINMNQCPRDAVI